MDDFLFVVDLEKAHVTAHFVYDPRTGKRNYVPDYDDSRSSAKPAFSVKKGDRVKIINKKSRHYGKMGTIHSYDSKWDDLWIKVDGHARTAFKADHVDHDDPFKVDSETPLGVSTIAKAFNSDLVRNGSTRIVGKEINSPADLAVAGQVWRNPHFESFRLIYIKDGQVVDQEGVTQRLPGSTRFFLTNDRAEEVERIKERIKAVGADSIYMLHNHPSGNPEPSQADIVGTKGLVKDIPEIKGHVIVNSGKYCFIEPDGKAKVENLPKTKKEKKEQKDELLEASIPNPWLGEEINTTAKVANIGKQIYNSQKDMPIIFYLDNKNQIRGLQEASREAMLNSQTWIEGQMRSFGVSVAAVFDPHVGNLNEPEHQKYVELIKKNFIIDAASYHHALRYDLEQQGLTSWNNYMGHFAGKARKEYQPQSI